MNKTNKELAVELAIALINANPRIIKQADTGGRQEIAKSITPEEVKRCVEELYNLLKTLNDSE